MFIHNQECNHGRTNETRDRLRKRLHQIHSKSSTKLLNPKTVKNQPGALKKMLASKVTPANNSAASGSGSSSSSSSSGSGSSTQGFDILPTKQPTKPVVEQKDNSTNEILEAALQDNFVKIAGANNVKGTCSKVSANNPITANNTIQQTAKKRKILPTCKPDSTHQIDESGMCKSCDGKTKNRSETTSVSNSDIDSTTTRNQSKSAVYDINLIIDFIEGNLVTNIILF